MCHAAKADEVASDALCFKEADWWKFQNIGQKTVRKEAKEIGKQYTLGLTETQDQSALAKLG